jgi:hypothetical protein
MPASVEFSIKLVVCLHLSSLAPLPEWCSCHPHRWRQTLASGVDTLLQLHLRHICETKKKEVAGHGAMDSRRYSKEFDEQKANGAARLSCGVWY